MLFLTPNQQRQSTETNHTHFVFNQSSFPELFQLGPASGKGIFGKNTTTILRPFFRDHPGEPVPEENFWTLWCKGRLTEADTPTIRLGATPSGLTSACTVSVPYWKKYR